MGESKPDIVERLRDVRWVPNRESADEIERLRASNRDMDHTERDYRRELERLRQRVAELEAALALAEERGRTGPANEEFWEGRESEEPSSR